MILLMLLVPSHIRHDWGMHIEKRGDGWHPVFV